MTDTSRPYGEGAVAFAEIARTLFSDRTVRGTLQRIVDFAVETVDGCDAAGISLLAGAEVSTPVWSSSRSAMASILYHAVRLAGVCRPQ